MRARAKRMRPYAMSPTQASPVVRVRAGERSNSSQDRQLPWGVGYIPCDDRCLVTHFPHHGMRGSEKIAVTIAIRGTEEKKCYLRHMTLPTTLSLCGSRMVVYILAQTALVGFTRAQALEWALYLAIPGWRVEP